MQTNPNTNIEHIIAKIDNDFNIDHSDWIPRVAAWAIEALGIGGGSERGQGVGKGHIVWT